MNDLFSVVTVPLKKLVNLLFSLSIGDTNLASLIVVGSIFIVLIGAIMHFSVPNRFGSTFKRLRERKDE